MELARDPIQYSRLLILVILIPLLLIDVFVTLPEGTFFIIAGGVFFIAAVIHAIGDEYLATMAWILFGLALGIVFTGTIPSDPIMVASFIFFILLGFILLAGERYRMMDSPDSN